MKKEFWNKCKLNTTYAGEGVFIWEIIHILVTLVTQGIAEQNPKKIFKRNISETISIVGDCEFNNWCQIRCHEQPSSALDSFFFRLLCRWTKSLTKSFLFLYIYGEGKWTTNCKESRGIKKCLSWVKGRGCWEWKCGKRLTKLQNGEKENKTVPIG